MPRIKTVPIGDNLLVRDLAQSLGMTVERLVAKLEDLGEVCHRSRAASVAVQSLTCFTERPVRSLSPRIVAERQGGQHRGS